MAEMSDLDWEALHENFDTAELFVNRRPKLTPDRRSKLTPCLVVARNGSARPGGAGRGCAAGASAGRFAV